MRLTFIASLLGLTATSVLAQVPCTSNNLGTNLGITDETLSAGLNLGFTFVYNGVGYTSIQVADNGYVTLGSSGGAPNYNPAAATLVADPFPRICPLWTDLDPGYAGNGDVYFTAVAASGSTPAYAQITWKDVLDWNTESNPHTFQLFLIDGGQIRCSYDNNIGGIPAGNTWLVGASPGNGATQNPVSFASLPILTSGSATLHESGSGPSALAGRSFDWIPDGAGGYIVLENTSCASAESYGTGCIKAASSFYEYFPTTPSIDLSNSAFAMTPAGATYVVLPSTSPFRSTATATNLGLGDDSETTVNLSSPFPYPGGTTSSLVVCSNGFVSVASNGVSYQPNVQDFLDWTNPAWSVWRDFIPNATANVWFEETGGVAYITWLNVIGYVGLNPGVTPSTFQLQFHIATGVVDYVFQSMDTVSVSGWTGGEGWIVGYSSAGNSLDPTGSDLSVLPIVRPSLDVSGLALTSSSAPFAGSMISLDTANIPVGTQFGAILLGLAKINPGLDLTGIGMPSCFQYTDGLATLLYFPAGSTASLPYNVPNAPGLTITAQSVVYAPTASPTTPLGALASNGVALHIN